MSGLKGPDIYILLELKFPFNVLLYLNFPHKIPVKNYYGYKTFIKKAIRNRIMSLEGLHYCTISSCLRTY